MRARIRHPSKEGRRRGAVYVRINGHTHPGRSCRAAYEDGSGGVHAADHDRPYAATSVAIPDHAEPEWRSLRVETRDAFS